MNIPMGTLYELNQQALKSVPAMKIQETTKAVNLMLRPPLTTLVTRLIDTTLSSNSN